MFSPIKQSWPRLSKTAEFETSFLISDQACKCMFKVNNKDTRMTSIQGNQMYLHTYFTIYSVLSIPCIMVLVVSKQSIVFCQHFFVHFQHYWIAHNCAADAFLYKRGIDYFYVSCFPFRLFCVNVLESIYSHRTSQENRREWGWGVCFLVVPLHQWNLSRDDTHITSVRIV